MDNNEKKLIYEIERLNLEVINLKQSKEYRLGKKIVHFKKLLKKLSIKDIYNKLVNTKKMEKLIKGQFKDNDDYSYLRESITINTNIKNKILVYTCITGNYDEPPKIYMKEECCDYILFTNNNNIKSTEWNVESIPKELKDKYNNKELNRCYKMHPMEFKNYDYAIYIDGNIDIISKLSDLVYKINPEVGIAMHRHKDNDCVYNEAKICEILKKGNSEKIKSLIEKYETENMPEKYGLPECNIIITNLQSEMAKKIFEEWWKILIDSGCERDQIVIPYVLWKNNINVEKITILGNNVYKNPKFRIKEHN